MTENIIEGEWKHFVFKIIEKEDVDNVLENFRSVFCKDEPIAVVSDCPKCPEDLSNFLAYVLSKNDRLSFCAIDKATGQIAGLRITYIARRDDPKELPFEPKSVQQGGIFQNMEEISDEGNIFDRYGVNEYAELIFTSVNPEFRGHGLVTEIYRRSFALIRSRGISVCKSVFTSPFTQKVAAKYGFTEHARRKFIDFKFSNGARVLPRAREDQVAILMALKFE